MKIIKIIKSSGGTTPPNEYKRFLENFARLIKVAIQIEQQQTTKSA
ncbi:MAG: hypothetical protein ACM3KR_01145 [Deltaproteobacteria bacterium]